MCRRLWAACVWAVLATGSLAQQKPLEPLKPAPPLSIKDWIQPREKPPSGWPDLSGRRVQLPFELGRRRHEPVLGNLREAGDTPRT